MGASAFRMMRERQAAGNAGEGDAVMEQINALTGDDLKKDGKPTQKALKRVAKENGATLEQVQELLNHAG